MDISLYQVLLNDQKSVTAFVYTLHVPYNCIHRKRIHLSSKIILKTKIEQSLLLKIAAMLQTIKRH